MGYYINPCNNKLIDIFRCILSDGYILYIKVTVQESGSYLAAWLTNACADSWSRPIPGLVTHLQYRIAGMYCGKKDLDISQVCSQKKYVGFSNTIPIAKIRCIEDYI